MSLQRTAIALFALGAILTCTAAASAAPYIPPGNSAATQYTEAFPTAGGNVEVNSSLDGGANPASALGKRTARHLAAAGSDGRAVAALAAAGTTSSGGGSSPAESGHAGSTHSAAAGSGGGTGGGGASGGGSAGGGSNGGGEAGATKSPSGSSGVGEVVSSATLSSSGEMGIFLPLVLLAALAWALLFAWRRRQHPPAA